MKFKKEAAEKAQAEAAEKAQKKEWSGEQELTI